MSTKKKDNTSLWVIVVVGVVLLFLYYQQKQKKNDVKDFSTTSTPYTPKKIQKPNFSNEIDTSAKESPGLVSSVQREKIALIEQLLDEAARTNNPEKLELAYKEIIQAQKDFDHPIFNAFKGDYYIQKMDYVNAAMAFKKAHKEIPQSAEIKKNYANACFNAAAALYHDSLPAKCINLMQVAFNLKGDEESAKYYLGWSKEKAFKLLKDNKNKPAIPLLKNVLEVTPNDHNTVFNLGVAYHQEKMHDEAIEQFLRCLELNPNDEDSKMYLYANYHKKGDRENAVKYLPKN